VVDNGVKLIDPKGECFTSKWERYSEKVVNSSFEDFENVINEIKTKENIKGEKGMIYIGNDTRPSCDKLLKALFDGINFMKSKYFHFGLVTTPIIHYIVMY